MNIYTATVRSDGTKVRLMVSDMDSFLAAHPDQPMVCYTMEDEGRILYVPKEDLNDMKPAE